MEKTNPVAISSVSEKELIIKDKSGITLGRIFILDLSKENKFCFIRFKFYKENKEYIKSSLNLFLESTFNKMNLKKVNIIIDEEMTMEPFVESGFSLEGIISESIISNNVQKDEFIFGIDANNFRKGGSIKGTKLKGKDLELVVLTPEHSALMLEYYIRNKNYLKPFEPVRDETFYTMSSQRRTLIDEYKQYLNGEAITFGAFKDGNLVGRIRISSIVYGTFKNAFIGYSIDEKEQGKGYAKEAVKLVCDYAFEYMGLHRIEAVTLIDNIKSEKVLMNCGFQKVGTSPKYLFINGKWRDHNNFALINEK
ncbi:MAG: GNAT family N-acetyltransferase [Solirubrobacterales bacterium]